MIVEFSGAPKSEKNRIRDSIVFASSGGVADESNVAACAIQKSEPLRTKNGVMEIALALVSNAHCALSPAVKFHIHLRTVRHMSSLRRVFRDAPCA